MNGHTSPPIFLEDYFMSLIRAGKYPDNRPPPSSLPAVLEGMTMEVKTGFLEALRAKREQSA
jgi:hypothetical protein